MGSVISVVNRKGGVGKTTLTIALAETFVFEHKKNVAILDFDPQASASEVMLSPVEYFDYVDNKLTLPGLLSRKLCGQDVNPLDYLRRARHSLMGRGHIDLALLPNIADLWDVEWQVLRDGSELAYKEAVLNIVQAVAAEFDLVLIDCPPGRTISTEQAILHSDFVLCPVVPERLAVWGMDRMKAYFEQLSLQNRIPPWRFIISRAVETTTEGQLQISAIKERYPDSLLKPEAGLFSIGNTDHLSLKRDEKVVQRIAKFRDNPDDIKKLNQFYGDAVTAQLKRIANTALGALQS